MVNESLLVKQSFYLALELDPITPLAVRRILQINVGINVHILPTTLTIKTTNAKQVFFLVNRVTIKILNTYDFQNTRPTTRYLACLVSSYPSGSGSFYSKP